MIQTGVLLLFAVVTLLCIISSKLFYRFGVPSLLLFLILGMLFGSDGIGKIEFSDYELMKQVCAVGLIFILFYGGFDTNWKAAKPVIRQSLLISTLGVVVTALITGLFCHYVLGMPLLEGLLLGAVVSPTDAASVFSILRSRKLNLKGGMASLLEIESGSNDAFAYLLMIVILTMMSVGITTGAVIEKLVIELVVAVGLGFGIAKVSTYFLKRINFEIQGFYQIIMIVIAILAFALSERIGGNGYLCVYIVGIYLGNSKIPHKKSLIHFFDGISWLIQILLFFALGLLSFPSALPGIFSQGMALVVFLIFVARPIATFLILSWFKTPIKQQLFISWVGLRGAASIVFALFAMTYGVRLSNDIFHLVFFVALVSVALQGSLLPFFARKLDLVETEDTVLKTFNDYQEESGTQLLELPIDEGHRWVNKSLLNADIPTDVLVVMIKRNHDVIVPNGATMIKAGDILVLAGNRLEESLQLM